MQIERLNPMNSYVFPFKRGAWVEFVSRTSALGSIHVFQGIFPLEFTQHDLETSLSMTSPGHYIITDPHLSEPIRIKMTHQHLHIEAPADVKVTYKDPNPPREIGARKSTWPSWLRALVK